MVECCNVARCNITDNTCSIGLHRHPVEVVGGEAFMVRKQLMSKIPSMLNNLLLCAFFKVCSYSEPAI